jgi:hypothetical protein
VVAIAGLVLSIFLAVTPPIASYAGCTNRARFELLGPLDGEVAPTNTRVWLMEYVSVPADARPRLLDEGGGEVPVVETTIPLRNGLLVRLELQGRLAPGSRYAVELPDRAPIPFATGDGDDRTRPEVPAVGVSDRTDPREHCLRAGAHRLDVETSEAGLFFVAATGEDGDVAVTRGDLLSIPAGEGESIDVSVHSMDLAGNRSPPALPVSLSAGCTAAPSSRPDALAPIALWTLFYASCRMRLGADRRRASSRAAARRSEG